MISSDPDTDAIKATQLYYQIVQFYRTPYRSALPHVLLLLLHGMRHLENIQDNLQIHQLHNSLLVRVFLHHARRLRWVPLLAPAPITTAPNLRGGVCTRGFAFSAVVVGEHGVNSPPAIL